MSRYRKVDPKIWNDSKFRPLSNDGKLAFFALLTHPHMTSIGAMRGTIPGLAAELGWTADAMRDAIRHAIRLGMVDTNEDASYIGLPNFLKYNEPEGPNSVIKAWPAALELIPECHEKRQLAARCKEYLDKRGPSFLGKTDTCELFDAIHDAMRHAIPDAIPDAMREPSPIPEQEQEQEQEQEKEKVKTLPTDQAEKTSLILTGEFLPATPAGRKDPKPEIDTELQLACKATWDSYAAAYRKKYGVAPIRNAPVNSQIKAMVQRIGREESPFVAAFYLTHSDGYYVRKAHDTGTLLKDCEKLRMEWATGRRGTAAAARQADRTQTNAAAGMDALAMLQQGA